MSKATEYMKAASLSRGQHGYLFVDNTPIMRRLDIRTMRCELDLKFKATALSLWFHLDAINMTQRTYEICLYSDEASRHLIAIARILYRNVWGEDVSYEYDLIRMRSDSGLDPLMMDKVIKLLHPLIYLYILDFIPPKEQNGRYSDQWVKCFDTTDVCSLAEYSGLDLARDLNLCRRYVSQ